MTSKRSRRLVLAGSLAAALTPLAAGTASATTNRRIFARQKFFGWDNVDPATGDVRADRVVVSWFGVTSYAVAMGGRVFLLDAWVPRGAHSGYVPTTPEQVADLAPEAIFIGHGHFDHAADAATIAAACGATVVGTAEHCAQVTSYSRGRTPALREVGTEAAAPGTMWDLDDGIVVGVDVTVMRHLHSTFTPRDHSSQGSPMLWPPPDPRDVLSHPPKFGDIAHTLKHLGDEEGGSLLYQFRVPGLTLTWHDTSGPLLDNAPHVLDQLRALPPTDVQIGAIQGMNQYTNGLRDPRTYIEALRPSVFVPSHHDDWAPIVATRAENYRDPLTDELARIPAAERPELRFLADPTDYLRPDRLTFHIG